MNPSFALIVEGSDDQHVLYALLQYHHFEPKFQILNDVGYEQLIKRLPARLSLLSGISRLGVIVDADASLHSRWESIKAILIKTGYEDVPDVPDQNGTVIDHEALPRVGIWIMPNNSISGMLEDYLRFLVPEGDLLFERANRVLEEIPLDQRKFAPQHRSKAHIHTWLAWQDDPGTPLGLAITKRYLNADASGVAPLIAWLNRVFT